MSNILIFIIEKNTLGNSRFPFTNKNVIANKAFLQMNSSLWPGYCKRIAPNDLLQPNLDRPISLKPVIPVKQALIWNLVHDKQISSKTPHTYTHYAHFYRLKHFKNTSVFMPRLSSEFEGLKEL